MVENQAVDKNQPDRNKGEGVRRIFVFERKKQRFVSYLGIAELPGMIKKILRPDDRACQELLMR